MRPIPPAATSSRASAPSTISGSGTDDGLEWLTLSTALGRPPPGWLPAGRLASSSWSRSSVRSSRCPSSSSAASRRRHRRVRRDLRAVLPQLGLRVLERAEDVVVRARVRLHVRRQVLQRVRVAVERIGVVDPAVVPVVQQRLPARGRGGGRDRPRDGSRERKRGDADADEDPQSHAPPHGPGEPTAGL